MRILIVLTLAALGSLAAPVAVAQSDDQPHEAVANTGRYAPVNGLQMYYEVHGGGRPLVLLHGGGSTINTTFGKILPLLARTRQVIAVEQQGHGHTADIDRPLSFEQMADDTAELLRQLGIENADVFGFSNGGNVAMQMAIRHPRLVRRLIVASAFFRRHGLYPEVWESFKHATPEDMPAVLRDEYLRVAPDPEHLPGLVTKLMDNLLGFEDWPSDAIQSIRAPTMIMLGDADVVRPEHAVEMYRLLPHPRLAILPGGHGTYLGEATAAKENSRLPEMVVAMVEEFLDSPMPQPREVEDK